MNLGLSCTFFMKHKKAFDGGYEADSHFSFVPAWS